MSTETGIAHDFFADMTPGSCWLAGLIAADGHVARNGRRWTIAQSGDAGRGLIEHVRQLIGHTATVSSYKPPRGQVSYTISVGSSEMVRDLAERYRITSVKTLTYEWPALTGGAASSFLRGYIDGDGCVSTYPTPQGPHFLHLSFVGTPSFVADALEVIPAAGRSRRIERCANLTEVRFSGRHAWDACRWLYCDASLYGSAKADTYRCYAAAVEQDAPRWLSNQVRRRAVLECLRSGMTPLETAAAMSTSLGTVYRWKAADQDRLSA